MFNRSMKSGVSLKISAICMSFLVLSGVAQFQCNAEEAWVAQRKEPELTVENPVHDFGFVPNTKTVEHTFVVRNEGEGQAEIGKVETSCGCAPAKLDKRKIAPGDSVEVKVELSLERRVGRQRHIIKLHNNDPDTPVLEMRLEGTALQGIRSSPARLYLGALGIDSEVVKTVELVADTNFVFAITNLSCDSDFLALSLSEEEPGRKYRLTVKTVPPLSHGMRRILITADTGNEIFPELEIPVIMRVTGAVFSTPDELVIDMGRDEKTNRLLVVQPSNRAMKDFEVLEVTAPQDDIKVSITKTMAGAYRIVLEDIMINKELDGTVVKIKTNVAEMPELTVPVRLIGVDE